VCIERRAEPRELHYAVPDPVTLKVRSLFQTLQISSTLLCTFINEAKRLVDKDTAALQNY
jgi:hypothetical protein